MNAVVPWLYLFGSAAFFVGTLITLTAQPAKPVDCEREKSWRYRDGKIGHEYTCRTRD